MDALVTKRRWYLPTPAWLVWGAGVAAGVLYACERWRWFPVHYQKGFPVLLAVAVAAAVLMLILAWMLAALMFRRRVQFGLRTLLVFVTLCALACSWLAVRTKQARRQAEVVAAIHEEFGNVTYDSQYVRNRGSLLPAPAPPVPAPILKLLGIDFFDDVFAVKLSEPTDAILGDLVFLNQLAMLYLYGDNMTDGRLPQIEGLAKLRSLRLIGTNVTYEGVMKLRRALPGCEIQAAVDISSIHL